MTRQEKTHTMPLTFAPPSSEALPLHVIEADALETWLKTQPDPVCDCRRNTGFTASLGSTALVPDPQGTVIMALAGYGTPGARARGRFHLAAAANTLLPAGADDCGLDPTRAEEEALGWLLSGYVFDRYKDQKPAKARLIAPEGVDAGRLEVIAAGEALLAPSVTRTLIEEFARHEHVEPVVATDAVESLTDRESEVWGLIAKGLSNQEIAAELILGETTVKTHVSRVLMKLGVRDRVQAVVAAYESGVIRPGDSS